MRNPSYKAFLIMLSLFMLNCAGGRKYTLAPIKTFDPDNADIPEPEEKEENQIWDIVDMTFVYQIEKLLDLNWTARKVGKGLQVVNGRPADNVNRLDEVPNSSWYTNRHYHHAMTKEELVRGPNVTKGPDQSGSWTIVSGKFEGGTTGFTIKDARGDRYLLKFDPPAYQEMGSSAEVISTKILFACGYNVPQNTVVYFDPDLLEIGETAEVAERGVKRPMTEDDLEAMLKPLPRRKDGKIRTMASKFVAGKPVGVWFYKGTRRDDPNDRVHHEHRRELRGLRSISSWLNDADRRAANTLAVYTEDDETGDKYIKHYLIDMGSTLGSNNLIPHAPKYGNEYLVDPRTIGLQWITLGIYVKPWEFETGHINPRFLSVGYFESDIFDPGAWYPTYPNPAFEYVTLRDAYWGAKIVMSFTDEQIRAIVASAQMSNPKAEEYLIKTLIERRDKVGRYWFERMNPLDKFKIKRDDQNRVTLNFQDLAVEGNIANAEDTKYVYTFSYDRAGMHKQAYVDEPAIPISDHGNGFLDDIVADGDIKSEEDKIFSVKIRTQRKDKDLSKAVEVYFYYAGDYRKARIVGIAREE
ncbi:hypothetical protein GWN42_03260 [candidate division KSB1 bacterium]|nr:hypothetical protein [candidate division KSB1 bacterium]